MKLNAPKQVTWLVALVLALIGLIFGLFDIQGLGFLTDYAFLWAFLAAALLLLATWFEGL